MSAVLDELLELLELERIEEGIFRGQSQDLGLPQLYGGQVIGQSLSAAQRTVEPGRRAHSFHSYFLLRGDPHKPIVYDVQNIRDGRSYSTRRVSAIQKGRTIFHMTASFQRAEEGFEHQRAPLPEVEPPERLLPDHEVVKRYADKVPERIRRRWIMEMPIEIRRAGCYNPFDPQPCDPVRTTWFRANGPLPDDLRLHKYLLAYASDMSFLPTAVQPHGVSLFSGDVQIATLDHAMWFHEPFRMDEWLLYHVESPRANGGRALVRGQLFNRYGVLVASTIQEGVLRKRRDQERSSA